MKEGKKDYKSAVRKKEWKVKWMVGIRMGSKGEEQKDGSCKGDSLNNKERKVSDKG